MRIESFQLSNFRCFQDTGPIKLDAINILVGRNNSGKSSILKALHTIQADADAMPASIRIGSDTSLLRFVVDGVKPGDLVENRNHFGKINWNIRLDKSGINSFIVENPGTAVQARVFPNSEPKHFIVPFFSKRKVGSFSENVRLEDSLKISKHLDNLSAKLARVANPSSPMYPFFQKACEDIIGFLVTAVPSTHGQRPGVMVSPTEYILLDDLGDGIPHIVGLLVHLASSKGKLFLIEELENDLHPAALKSVLELIVKSAKENQFVITTHSNIVLSHLGSQSSSLIYHVESEKMPFPSPSTVKLIEGTPAARLDVLCDLGYTQSDFDLWDGWLFLEESSAERIIREFLIPYFAPRLSAVRTLSANGNNKVEAVFEDFNRVVLFTHLENKYHNRAWVVVDGDDESKKIVEKLQSKYTTWPKDRFSFFSEHQFEMYYPKIFAEEIQRVLSTKNKQHLREAKKGLLDNVLMWLKEDEGRARTALEESAAEVIAKLKSISDALDNTFSGTSPSREPSTKTA